MGFQKLHSMKQQKDIKYIKAPAVRVAVFGGRPWLMNAAYAAKAIWLSFALLKCIWMFDRITNIRQENVRIFDVVVLHTYYVWWCRLIEAEVHGEVYTPSIILVIIMCGVIMSLQAYAITPFSNLLCEKREQSWGCIKKKGGVRLRKCCMNLHLLHQPFLPDRQLPLRFDRKQLPMPHYGRNEVHWSQHVHSVESNHGRNGYGYSGVVSTSG